MNAEILQAEVAELRTALAGHGLQPYQIDSFAAHFRLLRRWNPTHNLTRVLAPEAAAVRHYLDCSLPLLGEEAPLNIFDIGSGAGFPGLMAAILWPETSVTLVEPSRKRASFLQIAAGELRLPNVRISTPMLSFGQTAARVLSRATFSATSRQELWRYVASNGSLWAWTTEHERSTWELEAFTWNPLQTTWHPYPLPTTQDGVHLKHGVLRVVRGPTV